MLTPKRLVLAFLLAAAALAATGLFAAKPKLDPESEKFYRTARLIMTKEENRIFLRLPDVPTRREFIEDNADGDLLVIGTHFGGVGSGRIVSTDDGHILAAATH